MKKIFLILFFIPLFVQATITPVFTCGFECGIDNAHLAVSGTHSWNTTGSFVRNGTRSGHVNPSSSSGSFRAFNLGSQNIGVARVYIYFASLPTGNAGIFADENQAGVYFKSSDSKLYTGYGGTSPTFGSTGISVTTGQWYRIDLLTNTSTNPWSIDAKIDGADLSQLTRATASSPYTSFYMEVNATSVTADVYFDDFILSTTSADYPIGGGYVNHFVPTSDGTHSGITSNDYERTLTGTDILNSTTDAYQLIDDVPLESGSSVDWINMVAPVASSYVENIFGPASGISTPTVAPRMVSIIIGHHAAGTGNYNAEWLLNDNGTTSAIFTASAVAGTTSVIYETLNLADPPSAASVWTLSGNGNFNNLRIRFGATSSVDANPDVYFDCAMAEAEFQEVVLTVPGTPSDKRHTTLGVGGMAYNKIFYKSQTK